MAPRLERLINLVAALLDSDRPMTAEQIRRSIAGYGQESQEAFRRAFERDKATLRELGVPIEVVATDAFAEQPDSYTIPKDLYYLPDVDLGKDELTALRMAADAVRGTGDDALSGFLKLALDAPPTAWTGPRVMLDPEITSQGSRLTTLYGALLEQRPVEFSYRPSGRDVGRRRVEPYGLVQRRGIWYLVGRDLDREEARSFRVSRFESEIEIGDGSYEIPDGFDASSHLGRESFEMGERDERPAVVRFAAPMRWWPEQNMSAATRSEGPDGSLEVEVPLANVDALIAWAIGFGEEVEILSPPEARADARAPPPTADRWGPGLNRALPRLGKRFRRILVLLPYVIKNPGATIDELAQRFDARSDEIADDLNLLWFCGLPGYGPGDLIDVSLEGDRVTVTMADYFAAPLRLTASEALALYVAGAALSDLPGMEAAESLRSALEKLRSTMGGRGDAGGIDVRLESGAPEHVELIERALGERLRIRLGYFSASRAELTERDVDPWGLVAALGHVYLVGFDHLSEEERMFRTDRIKDVEVLSEKAEVPDDFDPTRYRGAFSGEGSLEVELEIAPDVAMWFEDYYPVTTSKPLRGGWRRIELVSGGIPWAAALVVRLGKGARAVSPPAVADAARELAARIAALYEAPV